MTRWLVWISPGAPSAILCPKFRTAIRSATPITRSIVCSMRKIVAPSSRRRRMSCVSRSSSRAPMPAAGSSRSSSSGSVARARAISRRRRSPKFRFSTSSFRLAVSPVSSRSASARSVSLRARSPPRGVRTATHTLSKTLMRVKSLMFWKVRPIPRRTISWVLAPAIGSPWNRIVPEVGASVPVTTLNNVVLPEPLGPMRAKTAPRGTSRLTSSRALSPPKFRERFRMARIGASLTGPGPGGAPRAAAATPAAAEAEDLRPGDVDPDHRGRHLVLLHRAQRGAELRALEHEEEDDDDGEGEQDDAEILERGDAPVVDVAHVAEALGGVRAHHAIADPPRIADVEERQAHDLAEPEGGDGEIESPHAQRGKAHEQADDRGHDHAEHARGQQVQAPERGGHAREVGAEGEEALLAERHLAADGHEVDAEAEHGVNADDGGDGDVVLHGVRRAGCRGARRGEPSGSGTGSRTPGYPGRTSRGTTRPRTRARRARGPRESRRESSRARRAPSPRGPCRSATRPSPAGPSRR